jgi:Pyruvate/2-oxoacid:ferredoxin oxidoreductase delta subunit
MGTVDVYEKLREKISSWPLRVPATRELMEMLTVLYTAEEAEFLTHFTAPYQDGQTLDQITEKTGKPREKIQAIIDHLVSRGLLFRFTSRRDGLVYYTLMPLIPGIFEFYFSSGRDSDEKRKVAELLEKYFTNGLGMELGASDYPAIRVVPVEKTIALDTKINAELSIFPFEKMSEFIATSNKIGVINCACRTKRRCSHPVETCIVFDSSADFMVERGFGRYLSVEEALQLLDTTEKAGLVHCAMNTQTKPQFICNCCTCACLGLRSLVELHNPRAFAKSNFLPVRDDEVCTKCKSCVGICPFKANVYHPAHDNYPEKIAFLQERCVGCGLCAYHCPTSAIKMVKVGDQVPEKTPREMWMRVDAERVH